MFDNNKDNVDNKHKNSKQEENKQKDSLKEEKTQNMSNEKQNKNDNNIGKNEAKENNEEQENCKERILRLTAEFDNYKKRVSKDILIAKQTGKADLIRELLLVLDEFELALIAIKKSNDENLVKGIELLYSNLIEILRKNGLMEIKTDGIYNPYIHEIVLVQEDNTKKDGTIISVIKKGYMLNDILLRAASVVIVKNNLIETNGKNNNLEKDNVEKKDDNKKE